MSIKNRVLAAGAAIAQTFAPLKNICAHLNALHVYAHDKNRYLETNHYCAHLNDDVRQCLLYDSAEPNARLIGVEYMITDKLFATLPPEERRYWHSHVFEVKSGMLVMPKPPLVPAPVWEEAERQEMQEVVHLYGKIYHLWQVDRGDKLPMGEPMLMTSFTSPEQLDLDRALADRDKRFDVDYKHKAEIRKDIKVPEIHPDADSAWKTSAGQRTSESAAHQLQ